MNQLTQEQIKTLEDAFASYPDDWRRTHKYATMEGIQEQLKELNGDPGNIFYISHVRINKEINEYGFSMNKMEVGKSQDNFNYEDLLKEDKIIFTFPVLWHEWECDGTAWIMEKEDGTRYLKMTDHGGEYVSEPLVLTSRIFYYESVIADTKKALELLNQTKV